MSEHPLDRLLDTIDATLRDNEGVVAEADRTLSGSPYMSVLRANRADVATRARSRADARAIRAQRSTAGTTTRSRLRLSSTTQP